MPRILGHGRRGRPAKERQRADQLLADLPGDTASTVSARALAREAGVSVGTAVGALSRRRGVIPAKGASPAPISFSERSSNLNNITPERNQEENREDSGEKTAAAPVAPAAGDHYETDQVVRNLNAARDIIDAVAVGVDAAYLAQDGSFLMKIVARAIKQYGPCATFVVSLSNRSDVMQQRYRDFLGRHEGVIALAFHRPYSDPANTHLHVLCSSTAAGELRDVTRGGGIKKAYDPAGFLDYMYPALGTVHARNGNEGGLVWGRTMPASAIAAWMTLQLYGYCHRLPEFMVGAVVAVKAIHGNLGEDWLGEDWQARPQGLSMPSWRLRTDALDLLAAADRLRLLGAAASPTFPRDMANSLKVPMGTRDGIDRSFLAARQLILDVLHGRVNNTRDHKTLVTAQTSSDAHKTCPPAREGVVVNG